MGNMNYWHKDALGIRMGMGDILIVFQNTNIMVLKKIVLHKQTENGLLIEVANSFSVECSQKHKKLQILVSMINSCTLPITVTGIKVSDAVNFLCLNSQIIRRNSTIW